MPPLSFCLPTLRRPDTKGEILGVTTAIKAFAFGLIAFAGGGLQTFDESVPLIASSLLMTVSWIIFQAQKPKTAIEELELRLRVAKALNHRDRRLSGLRGPLKQKDAKATRILQSLRRPVEVLAVRFSCLNDCLGFTSLR